MDRGGQDNASGDLEFICLTLLPDHWMVLYFISISFTDWFYLKLGIVNFKTVMNEILYNNSIVICGRDVLINC